MKVRLRSDFHDSYDVWLDLEGVLFERFSTGGMSRPEMMAYLRLLGLHPPRFGKVTDLASQLCRMKGPKAEGAFLVVHLDERAHRGEGKVRLPLVEAFTLYPKAFAVEYVPSQAKSLRYLQFGEHRFWIEYESDDAWRSNCGEVSMRLTKHEKGYHPFIHLPLFAIDFVRGKRGFQAVDFNVAPGVSGTGIEAFLAPQEAADAIRQAVAHFHLS